MRTIEKAQQRKRQAQQGAEGDGASEEAAQRTESPGDGEQSDPGRSAGNGEEASRAAVGMGPAGGALARTWFEPMGPPLRVDMGELRRQSMYPPPYAEQRLQNEYRRIKRPLLANATGKGGPQVAEGNRIMLTSAMQREGKTFTALNLALSIALDPDFSVTLIDGDVARRELSQVLGVGEFRGLLDVLADDSLDPAVFTMPASVPSLSVMPAGSKNALSEELISSQRMSGVLARIGDANPQHIVLFDAPPVLATPDAVALSRQVGQIVVVVKSDSTPRHQVSAAVEQLDRDKAINMLLNQTIGGTGGPDYSGYYG